MRRADRAPCQVTARWIGPGWIGSAWIRPDSIRPDWIRLDWIRLAVAALASLMLALFGLRAQAAALGPIDDPYFETIEGSDAMADGVVTALAQDASGFLWIGTTEGLYRYDGYRLVAFTHDAGDEASLGADFVRDLLPASDGGLWVATGTGGLSRFDAATGRFTRFRHDPDNPNSPGHDGVLSLAPADAEARGVWLALAGAGIDRFDPDSGRFEHHRYRSGAADTIRHDTVRSLLRDRRGQLWIGTRRGLSRRLADGRFEARAAGIVELDDQYVYALFEASDGRIWVGTQGQGAGWIDPRDGSWHPLPLGIDAQGLSHPWVTDFVEPTAGRIWVATYGSGIDVLDAEAVRVERRIRRDTAVPGSLALDSVTSMFRDASGLVWVGSWGGGLQRHLPSGAFRALHHSPSRSDGLSGPSVLGVLGRRDGTIWVGTEARGVDVLDRQRGVIAGFRHDPSVPGSLPAGAIPALLETADDTVWIGARQSGLYRFDPSTQRFDPAEGATGSSDTRINALHETPQGRILITVESGLVEYDPASGRSAQLRMADGGAFGLPVHGVALEGDGRLWVATARGLLQRMPGAEGLQWVRDESGASTVSSTVARGLTLDDSGTLWVVAPDGLWFAPAPRAASPRFQRAEFDASRLHRFGGGEWMSDAQGRLWSRMRMFDPKTGQSFNFTRIDGVDVGAPGEGMPGRSHDGLLLFGGTRGLLVVDPTDFVPWDFEPSIVLTQLGVDGRAEPWTAPRPSLVLSESAHRFSVEFAALDLSAPAQNRYRYRLVGADDAWIETDAEHRVATYSKLWPGRYELQLSGSNRAGQWSPHQVSMRIEVLPAFWQTPWFLLLALALLGACVYLGVVWRTARIRRQADDLARLVAVRTEELGAAHRVLLETQSKLAMQERVAALGGLVAGVAHEVSTPLGVVMTALSGVADAWGRVAKLAESGASFEALKPLLADGQDFTALAQRNSDRVGELVAQLKAIVARRDSDRIEEVDLSVHLREVAALVGPAWRAQSVRVDWDLPEGLRLHTVPDALTEVLERVLRNTVDHAFRGRAGGCVTIAAEARDGGVAISIRDDGVGIAPEALGQVFDPFFTTRRGRDGFVGLGLYIAYTQVTQRLKGSIRIDADASGTVVRLDLPDLGLTES